MNTTYKRDWIYLPILCFPSVMVPSFPWSSLWGKDLLLTMTFSFWPISSSFPSRGTVCWPDHKIRYYHCSAKNYFPKGAIKKELTRKASANKIKILVFLIWTPQHFRYFGWTFAVEFFAGVYHPQDTWDETFWGSCEW